MKRLGRIVDRAVELVLFGLAILAALSSFAVESLGPPPSALLWVVVAIVLFALGDNFRRNRRERERLEAVARDLVDRRREREEALAFLRRTAGGSDG